ncbi:protein PTST, chloroplastic [Impatiens glandulifera]|uniref:protein PTST, chloroplastic n=1 Tax=Impatiens glandulifera TaxID=253017 RepID=UPI001FB0776B|nr:protein PTST, chloroplastic [Impatiens glandulifera]
MMGMASCVDNQLFRLPCQTRKIDLERIHQLYIRAALRVRIKYQKSNYLKIASSAKKTLNHSSWQTFSLPINIDEEPLSSASHEYSDDEDVFGTSAEAQPLSSDELKALLSDTERQKLIRKLSEANQQNRFLKRQLYEKEEELVNFKSELATMELEMQALVMLAKEITNLEFPRGSRKINGRYIQSHLLSRLQGIQEKLKDQIKGVEAAESKEVSLFWFGMAESVQVMGSFNSWNQGEYLSPEYNGTFSKFMATLMLRPGRYEIKFLVDGEWRLSPELPTVGDGLTENNLLIVG